MTTLNHLTSNKAWVVALAAGLRLLAAWRTSTSLSSSEVPKLLASSLACAASFVLRYWPCSDASVWNVVTTTSNLASFAPTKDVSIGTAYSRRCTERGTHVSRGTARDA